MKGETPKLGASYETFEGDVFKIIQVDDLDDLVEVQYDDGDIEEMELEDWQEQVGSGYFSKVTP